MIIFMFGIVLTIVLFIAMGFVRGEGMSWRVNKSSCWRWSVCSSSCFRAMSPFRQATPAL